MTGEYERNASDPRETEMCTLGEDKSLRNIYKNGERKGKKLVKGDTAFLIDKTPESGYD